MPPTDSDLAIAVGFWLTVRASTRGLLHVNPLAGVRPRPGLESSWGYLPTIPWVRELAQFRHFRSQAVGL